MLDTLAAEYPVLPRDGWEKMYYAIMADNDRFGDLPVERRYASLRTDPYWNALQVKYAYAVTCHKAGAASGTTCLSTSATYPPTPSA